jgi:hypothetical protein
MQSDSCVIYNCPKSPGIAQIVEVLGDAACSDTFGPSDSASRRNGAMADLCRCRHKHSDNRSASRRSLQASHRQQSRGANRLPRRHVDPRWTACGTHIVPQRRARSNRERPLVFRRLSEEFGPICQRRSPVRNIVAGYEVCLAERTLKNRGT